MSNIIIILRSVLITFIISTIFGLGGHLLHLSFWGCTLFAFGVQFILGWIWNSHQENNAHLRILEIQAQNALAESVQNITVSCAHCSAPNNIGVLLNRNNSFDCVSCKQKNAVSMAISTIRATEMIDNQDVLNKLYDEVKTTETKQQAPEEVNYYVIANT